MQSSQHIHILELGLACCGLEYHAGLVRDDVQEIAMTTLADFDVDVLVLAGTITHALRDTVVRAYENLGENRAVIGFGACTISGGPYWDSYSVLPGSPIPVDVSVPGCPPPPESLVAAFAQLREVLNARGAS